MFFHKSEFKAGIFLFIARCNCLFVFVHLSDRMVAWIDDGDDACMHYLFKIVFEKNFVAKVFVADDKFLPLSYHPYVSSATSLIISKHGVAI